MAERHMAPVKLSVSRTRRLCDTAERADALAEVLGRALPHLRERLDALRDTAHDLRLGQAATAKAGKAAHDLANVITALEALR